MQRMVDTAGSRPTFRTGVRNSATPRAVPFTELITFCMLPLHRPARTLPANSRSGFSGNKRVLFTYFLSTELQQHTPHDPHHLTSTSHSKSREGVTSPHVLPRSFAGRFLSSPGPRTFFSKCLFQVNEESHQFQNNSFEEKNTT